MVATFESESETVRGDTRVLPARRCCAPPVVPNHAGGERDSVFGPDGAREAERELGQRIVAREGIEPRVGDEGGAHAELPLPEAFTTTEARFGHCRRREESDSEQSTRTEQPTEQPRVHGRSLSSITDE